MIQIYIKKLIDKLIPRKFTHIFVRYRLSQNAYGPGGDARDQKKPIHAFMI